VGLARAVGHLSSARGDGVNDCGALMKLVSIVKIPAQSGAKLTVVL
jgi:hypothetical protein